MSKERELLEALKRSTESEALNNGSGAVEVLDGLGQATNGAVTQAAHSSGYDMFSALNLAGDMATSFMGDPLFYMKAVGVLIVALVIVTYSVELIFGN